MADTDVDGLLAYSSGTLPSELYSFHDDDLPWAMNRTPGHCSGTGLAKWTFVPFRLSVGSKLVRAAVLLIPM